MTSLSIADGAASKRGLLQHVLAPLLYDYSALEPCIDVRTMSLHHDKHHAGYVNKLNDVLEPFNELWRRSAAWLLLNIDSLPVLIRPAVQHNAGGHLNHSLFWKSMSPTGGDQPTGSLAAAINQSFGSFDQFKARFNSVGEKVFGSGWVWLVARARQSGGPTLEIVATAGHDNPIQQGSHPLLLNDVWEHAYYLRYENRRAEYLRNWWQIVNWNEVVVRFEHAEDAVEETA